MKHSNWSIRVRRTLSTAGLKVAPGIRRVTGHEPMAKMFRMPHYGMPLSAIDVWRQCYLILDKGKISRIAAVVFRDGHTPDNNRGLNNSRFMKVMAASPYSD